MDEATKNAIEAASEQAAEKAATKAVEHALDAFGEIVDEKIGASERRLGVMIEDLDKKVSTVAEGVEGVGERLDNHEKRIVQLEDTAGLPALEPAIEG